jgi:hypothetical protein
MTDEELVRSGKAARFMCREKSTCGCSWFGWRKRGRMSAHCSFAYSALACLRMGMSGSASFQRVRKSL